MKELQKISHAVVLCVAALYALLSGPAASAQVTVKGDNLSAVQVIEQIHKTTDYIFFYNSQDLSGISVEHLDESGPIERILEKVFSGTDIVWRISDKEVVLKKSAIQPQPKSQKQDSRTVNGIVVDESDKSPLIGATIHMQGTDRVAISDLDGKFTMDGVTNRTILEVSYVGFRQRDFRVGDLGFLEIALSSENELEGVVVVGAGTQKKVSVTGAIVAIKGDELKAPSSSLTSTLAGKLPGIIATTSSGEPGSTSDFYIRGIGTFGGRSTPLILLDDIEISASDLNNLPSESIESFSILKDASATAIYGARGANGVMLITTKSGVENTKTKIHISAENSFLQPVNRIEYVDGPTWMSVYNDAQLSRTPSATPRYSQEAIDLTAQGISPYVYPNVDWYNLMFKNFNMNQRANINIQGGGSKVTYYMGLQVNHDTGQLNVPKTYSFDSNIKRWTYVFQNNISYKPTNTTKIDLKINAQFGSQGGPGVDTPTLFYNVYNANPVTFPATFPAEEGDTYLRFGNAVLSGEKLRTNPYAEMLKSYSEKHYTTINASLRLDQKLDFITKGLSASALVNIKAYSESSYTNTLAPYYYGIDETALDPNDPTFFITRLLQKGTEYISQGSINRYNDRTFYFDARLNYNRTFGNHSVSAMLMYMQREYRNEVLPNRNQGFSGRATYDYKNRYLVEFNFGYNGTERIDSSKRFEFFPAVSLGYVISNEDFWKPIYPVVNHFKIRASYGLVGSDETGTQAGAAHFLYRDNVNISGAAPFYTGSGSSLIQMSGPVVYSYAVNNPCWERANKLDVGVDFVFFNQLNLTVDYFLEHRDRILQKRSSWPIIMGYNNAIPWANVGQVDNTGVEVSLNWSKELFQDFKIDLRGNFTYAKNKYVYIDEPDYPYTWQTQTGKPISATYGYIAEGLFKDDADVANSASQKNLNSTVMPGDIKYRDINGDGTITNEDKIMLSPYGRMPQIQYGFGLNINWKGFDLGVFFTGSANRVIMINNIAPFCSDDNNQDRNLMKWIAQDYWSPSNPNPDAAYPRLGLTNAQIANNMVPSSFWLRNGNFLRFKTLEFGYTYKFFRVFLNGDNIAVWSPFKLWDPELDWNAYPLQRTFNLGIQFNF